jgi:hypothetical protein
METEFNWLKCQLRGTPMLFAEFDLSSLIGYILAGFASLGGVVAVLYRGIIAAKDATIENLRKDNTELQSKLKSYEEIAAEALKSAMETANYYRKKYEDKPPIMPLAPVISESHSDSTSRQRAEADIATKRAVMAQIKLALGQEPRSEPGHAKE